ncbi:biopolymer transporter ExbD [Solimonas sp. SE-A11]|uniref:ExbD/TolR family protein n=1 Tax=Solimonas sp. SE-A11 TaxID=3054954 RepID=UPI00259D06E3|nr:biopolymer transporter ExbD [Solimonas sp. SE-A11]MDM4768822.1 biopolymer transporter ExbD [Solimonas sp. SE-A11]
MSQRIRRLQRHHKQRARAVHLNIVSLIDVFAVLVFFLLVSSSLAAARLNVISLNLPSPDRTVTPQQQEKQPLTVTLRKTELVVSSSGGTRTLANTPQGYNIQALSDLLVEVKKSDPSEQSINVLLEPDTPYDDLVKVMDASRITPAEARASGLPHELFPQISIGDAPVNGAVPAPAVSP